MEGCDEPRRDILDEKRGEAATARCSGGCAARAKEGATRAEIGPKAEDFPGIIESREVAKTEHVHCGDAGLNT